MWEDSKPLTPLTPDLAEKLRKEACGPDAPYKPLSTLGCAIDDASSKLVAGFKNSLNEAHAAIADFTKAVDNFIKNPAPTPQGKTPTPSQQR